MRSREKYFQEGLTWGVISSGGFAVRLMPSGFLFDQAGSAIFRAEDDGRQLDEMLASLNSVVTGSVAKILSPTISFTTGDIREYPILLLDGVEVATRRLVDLGKVDWDAYERSWDFQSLPILAVSADPT